MRTVNVRLLLILLGVVLALGVGIFALNKVQVRRNAGVFLKEAANGKERIEEARKEKNKEREIEEIGAVAKCYNKYLKLRPDDMEARKEFGDWLASLHDYGGAISVYEPLLRKDEKQTEVRRKVVEMALELAGYSQAVVADPTERASQSVRWLRTANNHLQDFLLKQEPNDGDLWEMAGRCEAALGQEGQEDKAVEYFEKAIELKPDLVDAYARLAGFLRQRFGDARAKEADEWIAKLLKANGKDIRAHLLAGKYYQTSGDVDKAEAEAAEALKIDPDNRDALLLATQCGQIQAMALFHKQQPDKARKELDDARAAVQRGIAQHAKDIDFYISGAQVEAGTGDLDKAIDLLQQGLRATDNNPSLLWYAADWMIQAGRVKDAKEIMPLIEKSPLPESRKGYLRGQLEFAQSNWKGAIEELEKARSGLTLERQLLKQVDLQVGRAYAQLGNADQAMQAYNRALDSDPFFAPAQAAMIEMFLSQGKIEAASEIYRQLIGRGAGVSPRAAARLMLMKHAQGKATERDWAEFDAMLEAAAKKDPNSSELPLIQLDGLLARGRFEEAEKMLLACRDKAPEKREFWTALIRLAQQQQQWDKADALLKQAKDRFGFSVELRLAVARGAVMKQGKEGFIRLRQAAEKLDKFTDDQKVALIQGLLGIALQADALEEAKYLALKLAELQPANVQVRFQIFELAMREGNADDLERLAGDIEKIEGRGAFWHYATAAWLAVAAKDKKNDPRLDEALKHLAAAAELRPSWGRVPMLAASILDQQGKTEEALAKYREAVKLGDRTPGGLRRLAQILYERQLLSESRSVLRLLGEDSGSRDVERLAARLESRGGDYDRALAMARKAAEDSTNFADYVWLGTVLENGAQRLITEGKAGQAEDVRKEAEAAFRKGVELNDKAAEAWIPLIRFLAGAGSREKAEQAVEEFHPKMDPKEAPMLLAQCYEVAGDAKKAKAQYEAALEAGPENVDWLLTVAEFFYYRGGEAAAGEKLVRSVLDGKVKASQEELCRARRLMAVILATRGGYANAQEALRLVDANLKLDASQAQDQRIKASVLATLPSRAQREKATEVFEQLVKRENRETIAPEDRFILAQLYLAQGDSGWTKFTAQMRELISSQGDQPKYLAFYIGALLKKGEIQNADVFTARLEKAAPNLFATTSFQADLLFRRGKYEEALQLLKGFIDLPGADPADRSARMRLVAENLEQLAARMESDAAQTMRPTYVRDAEMIFRQYVDMHPSDELQIIGFLARLGLVKEGLDAFERGIGLAGSPLTLAQAVVELLRVKNIDKEQSERAEALLKSAIERFHRATPLLILMADLYAGQGRYDEAEKIYREVLGTEPDNAVAMNNLAVMLALKKAELPEALKLINKALEISGPVPQMLDSRATVYMAMGKPAEALKDLETAVADLDGPTQYFHQAHAYLLSGKQTEARNAFEEAKKRKLTRASVQPLEQPVFDQLEKLSQ